MSFPKLRKENVKYIFIFFIAFPILKLSADNGPVTCPLEANFHMAAVRKIHFKLKWYTCFAIENNISGIRKEFFFNFFL